MSCSAAPWPAPRISRRFCSAPSASVHIGRRCAREEARVVTDYDKTWAFKAMLKNGVPFKCLGLRMGLLRVPELPREVEEGIEVAYAARAREYYGSQAQSGEAASQTDGETSSES